MLVKYIFWSIFGGFWDISSHTHLISAVVKRAHVPGATFERAKKLKIRNKWREEHKKKLKYE